MNYRHWGPPVWIGALLLMFTCAPCAQASFIAVVTQVGPDVVAVGSGTIDLTDLIAGGSGPSHANIVGTAALAYLGPISPTNIQGYHSISGPQSFGTGAADNIPDSGSGDLVGVFGAAQAIVVPFGYVSGTSLSITDTWNNQTLASLGLTPGTYTWTWGNGADADSFVLQIATPEPGSLWLVVIGGLGLLVCAVSRSLGVGRASAARQK